MPGGGGCFGFLGAGRAGDAELRWWRSHTEPGRLVCRTPPGKNWQEAELTEKGKKYKNSPDGNPKFLKKYSI